MRYSQLVQSMMRGVRNDLLGQPFHLLTGLDILGNLSSMVGTLSKGAAALSMDKKFIRSRQRQVCISAESLCWISYLVSSVSLQAIVFHDRTRQTCCTS
jgi:hypothetical protein